MKLVVIHYHLRPGGVRRVIELATPHIVRRIGFSSVVLATGEASDDEWRRNFVRQLAPTPVKVVTLSALRYFSEQTGSPLKSCAALRTGLCDLFAGTGSRDCLVWAHNLGLGRNILLSRELVRVCEARRIPLIAHQHDWWFEGRWQRWPEMRRCGFKSLRVVAEAVFPAARSVVHAAINRADAAILTRHFPGRAHWLPNPAEPARSPPMSRIRNARHWLCERLGSAAPVWLLPGRLLRRKNIAEALLLTRWLRPEAWLVTTGGVSSADEEAYAETLANAARERDWPLQLGILAEVGCGKPSVADLMAASEAVLFTSIQEGFGLSSLEAVAARRPLMARRLPNVEPDLAEFGFRFPQSYEEIRIAPGLFDWTAELHRQTDLFRRWLRQIPRAYRNMAGQPLMLVPRALPEPLPFSRLTLTAQIEVLSKPETESWNLCAPLNPFLRTWKRRAATERLEVTAWPRAAARGLSGSAYAARFEALAHAKQRRAGGATTSCAAQEQFVHSRLDAAHLFPLLWSRRT